MAGASLIFQGTLARVGLMVAAPILRVATGENPWGQLCPYAGDRLASIRTGRNRKRVRTKNLLIWDQATMTPFQNHCKNSRDSWCLYIARASFWREGGKREGRERVQLSKAQANPTFSVWVTQPWFNPVCKRPRLSLVPLNSHHPPSECSWDLKWLFP